MRYIFGDDRLEECFYKLLNHPRMEDRLYAYRWCGRLLKPALWRGIPYPDLNDWLRDEYGGGEFAILIRRGEKMIFTGIAAIATPLNWRK